MKKWERPILLSLGLDSTTGTCNTRAWVPVSWGCLSCGEIYCQEIQPTGPCTKAGCKDPNAGYQVVCNEWVNS